MTTVDTPFPFRCELGEGPHWDAATATLLLVDINGGVVHRVDPVSGAHEVRPVAPYVSLVVPIAGSDDAVCAVKGDVLRLGGDGSVGARHVVEAGRPGNRINDGKADPAGRLWCGSMSLAWEPGQSALYRIDERGAHVAVDGVTLSNGLDWDVERGRMYYIDSPERRVDVFEYDVASGDIADRRPFAELDIDGIPDGMAIDADGCVWVAVFGGGQVRRYDPDGSVDGHRRAARAAPHEHRVRWGGPRDDVRHDVAPQAVRRRAHGTARCGRRAGGRHRRAWPTRRGAERGRRRGDRRAADERRPGRRPDRPERVAQPWPASTATSRW